MDFQAALTKGLRSVRAASGVSIVYVPRGDLPNVATFTLTAVPGRSLLETADGQIITQSETRDYIVEVSEFNEGLEDAGYDAREPARGDRVKETVGSETHEYEVGAPGGEAHWRYSDSGRSHYRIHTSLVGKVET